MRLASFVIFFSAFSTVYAIFGFPGKNGNKASTSSLNIFTTLTTPAQSPPQLSDYREANAQERKRIQRRFDKGKPREAGRSVDAEFNGLPVVIEYIVDKEIKFQQVLAYLEQQHRLITWTPGYTVETPLPKAGQPTVFDFFYTRKAFTDAEEGEIVRSFTMAKRKSRSGESEAKAKYRGLPVVISRYTKMGGQNWGQFRSLLVHLEKEHLLVKWTKTYYVVTVAPEVAYHRRIS